MDLPFDLAKEAAKIAEVREREEEDLAELLSSKYGLAYVNLSSHDIDADALRIISETDARSAEVVAFEKVSRVLSLGIHNPNSLGYTKVIDDLKALGYTSKGFLISKKSLDKALARYADLSLAKRARVGVLTVSPERLAQIAGKAASHDALEEMLTAASADKSLDRVSHVIETVLTGAFALRASDIHLEPREGDTLMRLRIDGVLTDSYRFDPTTYHQMNARLKLLSGVKLNVSNRAQDGRFSIVKSDTQIEIRSSFIPGSFGEAIVMRILDPAATLVSYTELGINPKLLARLEAEVRRPNGMLLTTGPTGSGKTTTLYSFLRELQKPEIKIITVEDPIEYHLDGIVQTQVDGDKYTFAEGLRSIVRQDPDIIMVGEIRDGDTANIAIQAALTGHFVLSTLHTNSAAGTFPRLVDLGADPKSFGSAVSVSMAQRLVRRLDPTKRKERPLTDAERTMVAKVFETLTDKALIPASIETTWEPDPKNAQETGYKGRVGLYEAIFMDEELAHFLRDNPPEGDIQRFASKQGYLTMAQDGVLKALQGVTSFAEVADTIELPK